MFKRMFASSISEPLDLFKGTIYEKDYMADKDVITAADSYIDCLEETYEKLDKDPWISPIEELSIRSYIVSPKNKKVWLVEAAEETQVKVYVIDRKDNREIKYIFKGNSSGYMVFDSLDELNKFREFKPHKFERFFDTEAQLEGWLSEI